jgi:hypothetical protein
MPQIVVREGVLLKIRVRTGIKTAQIIMDLSDLVQINGRGDCLCKIKDLIERVAVQASLKDMS